MRWKRENPVCKGLWRELLRLELMRRELGRTDRRILDMHSENERARTEELGCWEPELQKRADPWLVPESLEKGMIDSPTSIAEKNHLQGVFLPQEGTETQHYGPPKELPVRQSTRTLDTYALEWPEDRPITPIGSTKAEAISREKTHGRHAISVALEEEDMQISRPVDVASTDLSPW
jgi:hypothetical protein